jgi:hypothetical protein
MFQTHFMESLSEPSERNSEKGGREGKKKEEFCGDMKGRVSV